MYAPSFGGLDRPDPGDRLPPLSHNNLLAGLHYSQKAAELCFELGNRHASHEVFSWTTIVITI